MNASTQTLINVHPLTSYNFGAKGEAPDLTAAERLAKRERRYAAEGARRSVQAVLLVHEHGHPHVLLLQPEGGGAFTLPGGRLKPGEGDYEGLQRKLRSKLCPTSPSLALRSFDVGELVCVWQRPHFDAGAYPYALPHVARTVETTRVFLVRLPEKCFFAVAKNWRLLAVPLFELQGGMERFGTLSQLPACLSRFNLLCA